MSTLVHDWFVSAQDGWQRMSVQTLAIGAAVVIAMVSLLSAFYQVVDGQVERAALQRAAFKAAPAYEACKRGPKALRHECQDPTLIVARLP